MPGRRRPAGAAAEVRPAVERARPGSGSPDTVATAGVLPGPSRRGEQHPRRVRLEIDVRDVDRDTRDRVLEARSRAPRARPRRPGAGLRRQVLNADGPGGRRPAPGGGHRGGCADAGVAALRMISRAYRNSLFMARICPTLMLRAMAGEG